MFQLSGTWPYLNNSKTQDDYFNEIRGFRIIKLSNEKEIASVIVDRPKNKEIYHAVEFTYIGKFSEQIIFDILDKAKEISLEAY